MTAVAGQNYLDPKTVDKIKRLYPVWEDDDYDDDWY